MRDRHGIMRAACAPSSRATRLARSISAIRRQFTTRIRFGNGLAVGPGEGSFLERIAMTHTRIKLIVAGTVIAAAVTFLAIAGVREGWVYFLPVDQYVEAGAQ